MAGNLDSPAIGEIVRLSSADASQHAEALRALATACFPGAVPADGDVLSALAGPWHDLSACEWLLAWHESSLAGMALLIPYSDSLQLSALAVAPNMRRRGIGGWLQEATLRRAIELELPRVSGSVDPDEDKLLRRYRAMGATDDGSALCCPGALVKPKVRISAPVVREAPFEWLVEWSQFEPLLARLLDGDASNSSAVDLGCGTSHLARHLAARFGRVVDIDRDPKFRSDGVAFEVHDWSAGAAAPGAPYDVAFDKSSLDATLAEDCAAGLLVCAFRSLAAGGRYVICSLYPPDFVEALAAPLFLPVARQSVARGDAPVAVLCLRKRECAADLAAMTAHCRGVQDAFFAARPLVNEKRRAALRVSFANALSLEDAYEALFTAEERRDYARADFLDDVAAFRGRRGGGGMGGEEALAFLAFAQ